MTKRSPLGIGSPIPRMTAARYTKNDEFYTMISDIEREMSHYGDHFRGRTVYLNCDDYSQSQFWRYFQERFNDLGLEKLVSTGFLPGGDPVRAEMLGDSRGVSVSRLRDGDFRSAECISILEESDIVVTNPPFSLFGDFVDTAIDHGKDFIAIGNVNSLTSRRVWKYVVDGRVRVGATGFNKGLYFRVPENFEYSEGYSSEREIDGSPVSRVNSTTWVTTLRRDGITPIELLGEYCSDPLAYPSYDNYDAIEVSRVSRIPHDYFGVMGVPVTFLGKHDPRQFNLLGTSDNGLIDDKYKLPHKYKHSEPYLNGARVYKRVFISRA